MAKDLLRDWGPEVRTCFSNLSRTTARAEDGHGGGRGRTAGEEQAANGTSFWVSSFTCFPSVNAAYSFSTHVADPLLLGGVIIACFVAFNIGGATTGPAFGPAVGANVLSKTAAGALMAVAFFVGAYTIGRRVVDTLGKELVHDPSVFTLEASIIVLFFIGGALLIGNLSGAPASTSMTAVGAIIGLGLATGELNLAVIGEILAWWILSPIIGF